MQHSVLFFKCPLIHVCLGEERVREAGGAFGMEGEEIWDGPSFLGEVMSQSLLCFLHKQVSLPNAVAEKQSHGVRF